LNRNDRVERFRALHAGPRAFLIGNPWDAGSARILAALGYPALATSSGAMAGTFGRRDGQVTLARRGARARAADRRGDVAAGLGGPGEVLRRRAESGRRNDPPRR
jgi:2-methylisocitrate lyase-like PEP mutase family enzyme